MKKVEVKEVDMEVVSEELSDEQFLEQLKEKAETIKSKYKLKKAIALVVISEEIGGKNLVGWIRKPGIKEYKVLGKLSDDIIEGVKVILNTCWLEGDDVIKTDEEAFLAVVPQIQHIMQTRESYILNF